MASLFTTKKRLLTLYVNKLEHILNNLKGDRLEDTPLNPDLPQDTQSENIHGLEEGISVLESSMGKVEKALHELASMGDNPELTGKEKEIEEYSLNGETILMAAFDYLLMLQARLRALKSSVPSLTSTSRESSTHAPIGQAKIKTQELPPIPIPTFAGNIWEWDSFWGIFNTNIHSQDVTEMAKFNYLLSSLRGEARDSIKKFQVTADNYRKAIQFLHNKYGNREALVNTLVEKLDTCSLHGQSIRDQRRLLEELQVIISQLEEKGEEVNNSWLIKKVLCKFPDTLKRKVITKKQGIASTTPFTMSVLFQLIDEILSTEELLLTFTEAKHKAIVSDNTTPSQKLGVRRPTKGICMFCEGTHPSNACNKYSTPQERSLHLRRNNLCLICASGTHSTSQCKGRRCFRCGWPHHTSCCFKGGLTHSSKPADTEGDSHRSATLAAKKGRGRDNNDNKSTKAKSHLIITTENNSCSNPSDDTLGEPVILQHHTITDSIPLVRHPFLPIGEVTIIDNTTQALIKVSVLLDTGAELSFIDSSLAERLQLPVLEKKVVQLMTFGSSDVKKTSCNRVCLKAWDAEGNPHDLDLFIHNILTRPLETPSLPDSDAEFIRTLNLPIKWEQDHGQVTPSILLGCDQLWSFMEANQPTIALPSGMRILPTTLGYLISGRPQSRGENILQIKAVSHPTAENEDHWTNPWTMDVVQQYAIQSEENEMTQEEKDKWDNFWTLESAGTEEFTGTEKQARTELDAKVWERFNDTVQRRPDGYYLRLPWIEQHPYLPDNKALAYRRLVNVWASISKDDALLEQYDNIFREQLRDNIIEQVEESTNGAAGEQIHYIPHQPVITPHKATTKLRIVFDASAHYKNCPSLNDVLYRGPVIPPPIYGILLRLRIGSIALISDIEKAFLQVRLQEQDRDATRCFWLRNYKTPPSVENTIKFRFTRVTFGLKSSPFLLVAAIRYHLNTYQTEDDSIRDIKKNMYVDNLILTTDTLEEAIHVYRRTKQMFQEINMNLREFSSNNHLLVDAITGKDRAIETHPKVLGLLWDTNSDTILASCHFPGTQTRTKRTITSVIASIYDPLGWILPLLHKAKVFLRELWKDQYAWGQNLPTHKENEWDNIIEEAGGFEKRIPRYCAPKEAEVILVTFADASLASMAACTYLCYDATSFLVMAKSKLPSLQVKYTIPKLE
uniref:DUF1758 domain-containing protein n=1 Tax=Haemonchus contortus TaxID=6289 RepID=A0A7I4YTA2_HAECO